jgi:hypothetical protein
VRAGLIILSTASLYLLGIEIFQALPGPPLIKFVVWTLFSAFVLISGVAWGSRHLRF